MNFLDWNERIVAEAEQVLGEVHGVHWSVGRMLGVMAGVGLHPGVEGRVAEWCGLPTTTLASKLRRAGLPSVADLAVVWRRCLLAGMLDDTHLTGLEAAIAVDFHSGGSLNRHLRETTGLTFSEFRSRYTFNRALEDWRRLWDKPNWRKVRLVDTP